MIPFSINFYMENPVSDEEVARLALDHLSAARLYTLAKVKAANEAGCPRTEADPAAVVPLNPRTVPHHPV